MSDLKSLQTMADAGEISVNVAFTAFLLDVDISMLKDEWRRTLLYSWLALPTVQSKTAVHYGLLPWGSVTCLVSFIPLVGGLTGIFHSKMILHTHRSLWMYALVTFSNSRNHSGVSRTERIPPYSGHKLKHQKNDIRKTQRVSILLCVASSECPEGAAVQFDPKQWC